MKAIYVCPFRRFKFDEGRLSAFFLCRVSVGDKTKHEPVIIYRQEWENQGGE